MRNLGQKDWRAERRVGFTLVEVLTALAVLIFGMAAILGVLYGTYQNSHTAADRDAAAMLIPEAVRQIAQEHLITQETAAKYGIQAGKVGLYVQTVRTAPENDETSPYSEIEVTCPFWKADDPPPNPKTVNLKPPSQANPPSTPIPPYLLGTDMNQWPRCPASPMTIAGGAYRVLYRLQGHPDQANYEGLYVLTLVCYRDAQRDGSQLVQITDPVTVYLRKR